jgi:ribosomal protein S18 acetylase RimI-like enzyme
VIDELRNLGIGRELLTRSLQIIENLGGGRIYVETSSRPQYGPTRVFYSNHGFEIEAVLKDFYERGDHKMIYVRTIE